MAPARLKLKTLNDNPYLRFITQSFRNVPTSILVGMLLVSCLGTVLLMAILKGKSGLKWSAVLLLLEYLVLLILLSVVSRAVLAQRTFCSTPFWSYRAILEGENRLLTQNIANVGAFVPIGLLLGSTFGQMKWWKELLIGGAFSVMIEILQLVLRRGFAEFDDVFHNVVGCMIGYGVYVGIEYLVKRMKKISDCNP